MVTKYRSVAADPGWQFGDSLPGPSRGAAKNYRTMSLAEICAFKLPDLEDDCRLFLWRVASMQEEALAVMRAWGFTLKAEMVWVKETVHGRPHFGMGRTVRNAHEVCLIGVRGKPEVLSHSVRSVFSAPVERHSEKPDRFFKLVGELSPRPYVELFARRRRVGWDAFGDELETGAPNA